MNHLIGLLNKILVKIREVRWRILRAFFAFNAQNPVLLNPKYYEDGIITIHIPTFLEDPKFCESYQFGVQTGALAHHRGGIAWRAYINTMFAKKALSVPGLFIECGVGKGLYSRTIAHYLNFQSVNKEFYLLDTFSGIPINQLVESEIGMALKFNHSAYAGNYLHEVKKTFSLYDNIHVIPGILPGSLKKIPFKKKGICYLQIDLNNAFADSEVLKLLFPYISKNGIVIIDDYSYSDEFRQTRIAIDAVADAMNFSIISLPTGQGLIVK